MRRASLICLALLFAASVLVAVRPHASYSTQDRDDPGAASSRQHLAGTDTLGRDRLTRVAVATVLGLGGSVAAAAVSTLIAASIGVLAAFGPKLLTAPLLLACDAFLALPWIFLLMMVRSGMPLQTAPLLSAFITFLTLALLGWPACARGVHASAWAMRNADWMTLARASGTRSVRLVGAHLVPQIRPLLLPQFLISVPAFLMAEANLGTLGLGVAEPLPSWGAMLLELDNSAMLVTSRWVYLPIALLVGSLVLLELLLVEGRA